MTSRLVLFFLLPIKYYSDYILQLNDQLAMHKIVLESLYDFVKKLDVICIHVYDLFTCIYWYICKHLEEGAYSIDWHKNMGITVAAWFR